MRNMDPFTWFNKWLRINGTCSFHSLRCILPYDSIEAGRSRAVSRNVINLPLRRPGGKMSDLRAASTRSIAYWTFALFTVANDWANMKKYAMGISMLSSEMSVEARSGYARQPKFCRSGCWCIQWLCLKFDDRRHWCTWLKRKECNSNSREGMCRDCQRCIIGSYISKKFWYQDAGEWKR